MISAAMCVVDGWAVGGMHRSKICHGDCGYSDDVTDTVLIYHYSFFPSLKIMYDSPKEAEK